MNKKFNIALPDDLYSEVYKLSKEETTTMSQIIRKFIKLGLMLIKIERSNNYKIIIKDYDRKDSEGERELKILI
ncbi:MAG: hypothetical protein ACOC1K_01230 [Nanoarchaeota archaeon]